jgi:protein subunit release factor A
MLKTEDLNIVPFPKDGTKGVKITHVPTGLAVISKDEPTMEKNKEKALVKLEAIVDNFLK